MRGEMIGLDAAFARHEDARHHLSFVGVRPSKSQQPKYTSGTTYDTTGARMWVWKMDTRCLHLTDQALAPMALQWTLF